MSRRFRVMSAMLFLFCEMVLLLWVLASSKLAAADNKSANADDDFFGLTKIYSFHLEFTPSEWQALEPSGGGFFGFGGGPNRRPERPADKPGEAKRETHKGGSFNMEFPWVHGEFRAEGQTYTNVGVRYKGGGSYVISSGKLKRNLKIDLERYHADQRFHGRKSINLNAGAADATKLREGLAYAVYRAAGVPAPRTAFAEVTLTVPGKYDNEFVGLYTVIEPVDRVFLKRHFQNSKGLLLKPERVRLLEYLGEDWNAYHDRYNPKREATKAESRRVIAFAKLVHQADDKQFQREIRSYLDLDAFLRFLGVTALLANLDNTFFGGHNVYLYLDPSTQKFFFIPWDLDLAFGGFFLFGPPEQQTDLSVTHPYPGDNKLVDRLLAIQEVSARYQKILKELAATCFAKENLLKDLHAIQKATRASLARETKAVKVRNEENGPGFGPPMDQTNGTPFGLREFIVKRTESITAQLEGKSKGMIPRMGFGMGGRGGFGQPGIILTTPVQERLKLTPEQKRELGAIQKEVDVRLEKLLTEDQRKQLRQMQQGPGPGGRPPSGAR